MKKITILFSTLLFVSTAISQQKVFTKYNKTKISSPKQTKTAQTETETTQLLTQLEKDEKDYGSISENISFGLSLGSNNSLENLKLAQISPIDNTLIINNAQKSSFVLSTAISVPVFITIEKHID